MSKRKITIAPIMHTYFESLEDAETMLRASISRAYDLPLSRCLAIIMAYLTDDSPMNAKISSTKARAIEAEAREAGIVMSFDEIYRLSRADALAVELSVIQAGHAKTAGKMIEAHMRDQAVYLWDALAAYLAIDKRIDERVLNAILNDPDYPVTETLVDSCMKAGRRTGRLVLQLKAQGMDDLDIIREADSTLRRTTRQASDIVTYYEDTRVASDVALECLDETDFVEFFRTRCIHDDKTCRTCLKIEDEQSKNPVRIADRKTGINSPPFHPWCRCWVEPA